MRRLRAVLVDDERLARVELRRLLAVHDHVEIVGEAANADEARALLDGLAEPPDVLFLDIQMPGETGFDLLASLEAVPAAVVFVTAYDAHALRAFEVSALDYLVKPVAPARLADAVRRLDGQEGDEQTSEGTDELASDEREDARPLQRDDRVFVKDGDRLHFVRLGDVRLFESEGNYVRLYTGGDRLLVLRSLSQLEARLDPALFFRASRRHIVNLERVVELEDWFGGALRAVLDGGETVEMSRRQAQRFRERTRL